MSASSNGTSAMVADGANHVWVRSGWEVTRIDAQTGESKSWDVGDDAVFASPGLILAPALGSGVWLLDGGRIRLFDGDRFAVDLQVPEDVLDVTDAAGRVVDEGQILQGADGVIQGTVEDVVERGAELWLSIQAIRISDSGSEGVRWSGREVVRRRLVRDVDSGGRCQWGPCG